MNRYSAEQERAAGRRTLPDTQKLIYFGPGHDSAALTGLVRTILHLEQYDHPQAEPRHVFERTKTGKHYRIDREYAQVLGIKPTDPGGLEATDGREFATIHDTLEGVITYIGHRASLGPDRLLHKLRTTVMHHTVGQATELAVLPSEPEPLDEALAPVIPLPIAVAARPELPLFETPLPVPVAL